MNVATWHDSDTMKRTKKVGAREFNQKHSVYMTQIAEGECRKVIVTHRGKPKFQITLYKTAKTRRK